MLTCAWRARSVWARSRRILQRPCRGRWHLLAKSHHPRQLRQLAPGIRTHLRKASYHPPKIWYRFLLGCTIPRRHEPRRASSGYTLGETGPTRARRAPTFWLGDARPANSCIGRATGGVIHAKDGVGCAEPWVRSRVPMQGKQRLGTGSASLGQVLARVSVGLQKPSSEIDRVGAEFACLGAILGRMDAVLPHVATVVRLALAAFRKIEYVTAAELPSALQVGVGTGRVLTFALHIALVRRAMRTVPLTLATSSLVVASFCPLPLNPSPARGERRQSHYFPNTFW